MVHPGGLYGPPRWFMWPTRVVSPEWHGNLWLEAWVWQVKTVKMAGSVSHVAVFL